MELYCHRGWMLTKEGRDDFRKTAPEGGYIPNPYGRDLGLGYRVRTPSSQEGDRGVETKQ